jgi:hypothetical protein
MATLKMNRSMTKQATKPAAGKNPKLLGGQSAKNGHSMGLIDPEGQKKPSGHGMINLSVGQ